MRNLPRLLILTLSLLLLAPVLHAEDRNLFFCPDPAVLIKDKATKTWSAQRKQWKSYEISFVNKINLFLGAQWVGANVGQVTCVYQGDDAKSFPIMLVFHTLTYAPTAGKWSDDLGGYRNCNSEHTQDCPFKMRLRPQKEDINQELEQLKSQPHSP